MDIGIAIGGAFLSSVLQVLFDRLAPKGELLKLFQRDKHDVRLLKKLRTTLVGLQAVLSDAENKQTSNPYVSQWLNELEDAVDSAEDLMEQVNYEVLRLKVESQHQVSDRNLILSDEFSLVIKEKLEYTIERLGDLEKQIGRLDLKAYVDPGKQETRNPSTSLVDESDIFGRHSEIKVLVDLLLSPNTNGKNLTVVPIVGMGGIGKTTVAKAVYNDEKVKDQFELRAWICVSEPYDAFRITKGLLQEIGPFDSAVDGSLNKLQIKLKENLKGKRFLIVLDDIWNDNYDEWDALRNIFVQGDMGSKIIVTTRKESVALMMGSGAISVGTLSNEASWALFKRHSLENRDNVEEHPELNEIGKKIAHKCKGLPLAIKALAGMLRSKSAIEEWKDILRSATWELHGCLNRILPALMLSYNDLPTHLKRCFAYCAIFPKDYPFCKEQVIHLWIANGLVQSLQKGNQYFVELRSRSLFDMVPNSTQRDTEKYLMHDLVNDLAQTACSKLCIRLEDNEGSQIFERSQHVSYQMGYGDFEKLKPLHRIDQLKTLLPINISLHGSFSLSKRVLCNTLPKLTSLRALSLSGYYIMELPSILFIKLKLLRFLDLSHTQIKKLPDSICVLYNLETLLLSSCDFLEELPPQIEKLINLHYLDVSNSSRLKMPHQSKLKSLHVLLGAKIFLGGGCVPRIGDLGELHNLYGSLSILELQKAVDRREALKANLREKKHVEKLSLEWSGSLADNSQNERDILDDLQPNTNIKELQINGYRGTKFPNWLADHSFLKLVELSLSNCKDCDSLPALGQLPVLKLLTIRGMHRLTEVTEEFYGDLSSKKPFNSLEKLEFAEMLEWRLWHVLGIGEFPVLQDLCIVDCPKLMGMFPEKLCSLTGLTISRCPELVLETSIQLSSVTNFEVVGFIKVGVLFYHAELFTSQLQGMKQIVQLYLEDCQSLSSIPVSSLPNTLKRLAIFGCGKLKLESSVREMISGGCNIFLDSLELDGCDSIDYISPEVVPRLRTLSVASCHRLTRLLIPREIEVVEISECKNLEILLVPCGTPVMSLCHLQIRNCKKLKSLPECMQERLPYLKELSLRNCPEIESFPHGGLPFNLESLEIWNCKKLVAGRKEWHLQRLPLLTHLTIYRDGNDEEVLGDGNWEFPCSIQSLVISNLTLSSQVLKNLTSLESLFTDNLPQILSLLEEPLPSSLSSLTLHGHRELHSLPTEALQRLTSLQSLWIVSCDQLQSLRESELPSSLSELRIDSCPNLQSLPAKGIFSSISKLTITECPLIKPLVEFNRGEYWPEIAQIATVHVDGECL